MGTICIQHFEAPCGPMILGSYEGKLCLCDWRTKDSNRRERIDAHLQQALKANYQLHPSAIITQTAIELKEYFAGNRTTFDIPLLMIGTDFQRQAWQMLRTIPYGSTLSYAEEARRIGKPSAIRAVASANRANPISILVPCHRVIGSNGTLTGYGGGLEAKQYLLDLERQEQQIPNFAL